MAARITKGDRVKIVSNVPFPLLKRKNKNGIITKKDGQYVFVRPMWCKWEVELYLTEIEKL